MTSGEASSHHYTAPTGPDHSQHTHYMFYLGDVLAARFFLESKQVPDEVRGYVLGVVQTVVENVKENSGFKSNGTQRVATVDQLEVYRLLRAFSSRADKPETLLPKFLRTMSATKTKRIVWTTGFIAAAVLGSMPVVSTDAPSWLKVLGGVFTAISTGALVVSWAAWGGLA